MVGRQDVRRQRSDGVTPRLRDIWGTGTMNHCRRLEPGDGRTDLRQVEQIDTLPCSELLDLLRRRRVMRPPDDVLTAAERLDDVAAREAGSAGDKNRHD